LEVNVTAAIFVENCDHSGGETVSQMSYLQFSFGISQVLDPGRAWMCMSDGAE
jgi:hypothetical protein